MKQWTMMRGFCLVGLALIATATFGYEAVPQGTLVGQWFNGPADAKDHSGYTPSGTHDAVMPASSANGQILADVPSGFSGYCAWLNYVALVITNSATSHANYVNTFDEPLTNQFTVSFWAKNANGWQSWAHKTDNSSAGWKIYYLGDGTGRGNFALYSPSQRDCLGALTAVNQWHHYALVWSRSEGARWLYQDGILINSATNAGISLSLAKANALQYGGSGNLYLFDYRVYKQKMSQDQVKNIMTATPVMSSCSLGDLGDVTVSGTNITLRVDYVNPATNLVFNYVVSNGGTGSPASGTAVDFSQGPVTYTLTSTNGMAKSYYVVNAQKLPNPKNALVGRWLASLANLRDYSDYAPAGVHDGIATNGTVSFTNVVPAGFSGYSLDFSPSAGSVYIKNSATNDAGYLTTFDNTLSNQFTVAFWAKGIPTLNYQPWISKATEGAGSGTYGWACILNPSLTNMDLVVHNFANTKNAKDVSDNNWHHFVAVWDQSNGVRRLYVDGVVSVASNTAGQAYVFCPHRRLVLGGQHKATGFESWFNGLLYDVRIYKQIMYKAEVDAIRTVPDYPIPKGTMIRIF